MSKINKITELIQYIGKCRDIIATKDFKQVLKNIYLFQQVCDRAKVEVDRYVKKEDYELCFNCYDLQELSDEIFAFIKNYQNKFLFDKAQKKLIKAKTIDNEVLRKFTQEQCDQMYVDARLREAYKILSYLAITVWLWTEAREQEELDWQVTQLIRSFL